jgi:hypothetical protein
MALEERVEEEDDIQRETQVLITHAPVLNMYIGQASPEFSSRYPLCREYLGDRTFFQQNLRCAYDGGLLHKSISRLPRYRERLIEVLPSGYLSRCWQY